MIIRLLSAGKLLYLPKFDKLYTNANTHVKVNVFVKHISHGDTGDQYHSQ